MGIYSRFPAGILEFLKQLETSISPERLRVVSARDSLGVQREPSITFAG